MATINELTELFKILSDVTRQRLLAVLDGNELSVQELQQVLEQGQSSISAHLAKLRSVGIVGSRRDGKFIYYRLIRSPDGELPPIVQEVLGAAETGDWNETDQLRLEGVLRARREASLAFFDSVHSQNRRSPGQTWDAEAFALAGMLFGRRIVDVGCGNGRLSALIARSGNEVVGVDNSEEQIRLAQSLNAGPGAPRFVRAEAEALPFPDASADLVVFSHALHHIARPGRAIAEASRILEPGGRVVILDLASHGEEWLREHFGDLWMGFSGQDLKRWIESAGMKELQQSEFGSDGEYPLIRTIVVVAKKREKE